jgi:two-component system, OmpR family, phosphate regulon response regulator PhoB
LTQAGYKVFVARSGAVGLQYARNERVDIILLDLMLPDLDGTEVCRALRSQRETQSIPIIMLTARGDEVDRVVSFELGVDDYVVKPFSVRELLLRIRAILGRNRTRRAPEETPGVTELGCLRVDEEAHRVWVNGAEVGLTQLEFKLLVTLLKQRNRVQSRHSLLTNVWDIRSDVTTRTVDTHVKRLREKLGAARDYIETVRGVGYRFIDFPREQGGDDADPVARGVLNGSHE